MSMALLLNVTRIVSKFKMVVSCMCLKLSWTISHSTQIGNIALTRRVVLIIKSFKNIFNESNVCMLLWHTNSQENHRKLHWNPVTRKKQMQCLFWVTMNDVLHFFRFCVYKSAVLPQYYRLQFNMHTNVTATNIFGTI